MGHSDKNRGGNRGTTILIRGITTIVMG